PLVIEGKAPTAKDECMIGEDFAEISGLKVGDKVRIRMADMSSSASLSSDSTDADEDTDEEADGEAEAKEGEIKDALLCEEFTITALMKHPDYLRRKSTNVVALPWAAYDMEVTDGYYTHAFVKAEEPKGVGIFKDSYFKSTADQKHALEELADTLAIDSAERAKKNPVTRITSRIPSSKKAEALLRRLPF
ncbi:MAG: hypothetical protein IKT95_06980, partial [Spirochaetales bacterium]|nr:hypothetical protein [Spirochaetales bacterium]